MGVGDPELLVPTSRFAVPLAMKTLSLVTEPEMLYYAAGVVELLTVGCSTETPVA
jgi:hypothetical protein